MFWSKTHEIKSKYKLIFTFASNLLIFLIDHAECCFFFLSLTHFFITAICRFWTGSTQARKHCLHQKFFFLQNKGSNNPIWVGSILKNNLRLFNTLQVCHSVIKSTKWRNMKAIPTLILLEDISIKIVGRGLLYS